MGPAQPSIADIRYIGCGDGRMARHMPVYNPEWSSCASQDVQAPTTRLAGCQDVCPPPPLLLVSERCVIEDSLFEETGRALPSDTPGRQCSARCRAGWCTCAGRPAPTSGCRSRSTVWPVNEEEEGGKKCPLPLAFHILYSSRWALGRPPAPSPCGSWGTESSWCARGCPRWPCRRSCLRQRTVRRS